MKVLKPIILLASLISFVLGFIFESIWFSVGAIPFAYFIYFAFHEFGHVVACLITKTKVNYVDICGYIFSNKFEISNKIELFGKVNFEKGNYSKLIYFFGILFSLLLSGAVITLYILQYTNFVYLITICVLLTITLLPLPGSDIIKLFKRNN